MKTDRGNDTMGENEPATRQMLFRSSRAFARSRSCYATDPRGSRSRFEFCAIACASHVRIHSRLIVSTSCTSSIRFECNLPEFLSLNHSIAKM